MTNKTISQDADRIADHTTAQLTI